MFSEVKDMLVDGTERLISCPKDKPHLKGNGSGKKKRHTKKSLVVSGGQKVLMASVTAVEKRHDYRMSKHAGLKDYLAGEGYLWVNLGLQ
ncbi:hypothetical protein [Leptolyngbya sp. FACHB-261]|uniref:hypothetical protein n=1 Tax=Leptolyngbya sp. FACHB-261 TaxID=2692806 RepID=UPI00168592E8|nr:hypothetical protein [Leptolyngbya sp. FACHB-261]MBD2100979.1 hypothetical protein [Leptolyngbya sp. FACHB-261]